jgi:hypothetical protein
LIFVAKNELGIPTWKLAKDKQKRVTSRVNPMVAGKTFAIQPGRGKKSICRAKAFSCENRLEHYKRTCAGICIPEWKQKEAELEGFLSWDGLMRYFQEHNLNFMDLFRIEFDLVEEKRR